MAEAMLQGMAVRGSVAQGSALRVARVAGLAMVRGGAAAFRAVSSFIQVTEPIAQGCFGASGRVGPAMKSPGQA